MAHKDPSVVIIGAGMTGILLVIKLREAGITNITVFEKADRVGGTWRENTYPGVACDVPSHMYTYDFEPNPDWAHRFATGAEIQRYFERVADKYDVCSVVRFNEAVTSARFEGGQWHVRSSRDTAVTADFVIAATGILHHPACPDIPGLGDFAGRCFHTARWDHEVAIGRGVRVGVIGTGSTAAQCIPELIATGADVSVFQRTAQWILPIADRPIKPETRQRMRKNPVLMKGARAASFFALEQIFTKAVTGHPLQRRCVEAACKLNLRLSVKDPVLRQKLTPDYRVGCKRLIINKTFYRAIQQSNAQLVTDGIERIVPEGVVTRDGRQHPLDVLVLATGFDPFSFMRPMQLTGKDGLDIETAWQRKIRAYRSLLLPGFPNFFLMLGPNTPIGNFSVIAMSEVQTRWLLKLVDDWRRGAFNEVQPSEAAIDRLNARIRRGMAKTAWTGGCQSWYLDADGDPILWPFTWRQWVEEMETPVMEDLVLS